MTPGMGILFPGGQGDFCGGWEKGGRPSIPLILNLLKDERIGGAGYPGGNK